MAKTPKMTSGRNNSKPAPKPVRGGNSATKTSGRGTASTGKTFGGGGSNGRAGSKGTTGSFGK